MINWVEVTNYLDYLTSDTVVCKQARSQWLCGIPHPNKYAHEKNNAPFWAHQILTPREQGSHVCIILFNPDLVAAVVTLKYLLKWSENDKFPASRVNLTSLLSFTNAEQFHTSCKEKSPSAQIHRGPRGSLCPLFCSQRPLYPKWFPKGQVIVWRAWHFA